jgi:hypothetical protein
MSYDINLDSYPKIKAFLDLEPADAVLFGVTISCDMVIDDGRKSFSVIDLCCLLGKHNHLTTLFSNEAGKVDAIRKNNYRSIKFAARNGHTATIQYLVTLLTPAEIKLALHLDNYWIIRKAAGNGHMSTIKYLETFLTPTEMKKAIQANDYKIIIHTAEKGHTKTIEYLETHLTSDERKQAVKVHDYSAIRLAACHGHTATIQYLETHLTSDEKKQAVQANNYQAIREAAHHDHEATCQHFLRTNESALAYMEQHDFEYNIDYVSPVILEKITGLKACTVAFSSSHPGEIFNIDGSEASYFFYVVRNLIRRGVARGHADAENVSEDLRFLLSIPAIAQHAALSLNGGMSNELLRLAITLGNTDARNVLLELPNVYQLAQTANFYRNEAHGGLNIRALAQDRESAMLALSTIEQRLLTRAADHYKPLLKANGGVDLVMADLRKTLHNRYIKAPAQLIGDDKRVIFLPCDWQAFTQLTLSATERAAALKAYYSHVSHSAWRYLAKPNPWLHPQASFVCVDDANPSDRWSKFKTSEPLIALLWLAVTDDKVLSTTVLDIEGRIAHFIEELRLIGRAHNWDKTRELHGRMEEFDDLEGDRPSCYSGTKRRLFQAVIDHPLFTLVTLETIKQTLRDLVFTHFKEILATANNYEVISKAFTAYFTTLDEDCAKPLAVLNLTASQQATMIAALGSQYGEAFTDEPSLVQWVRETLMLRLNSTVFDYYHALKLDGLTQFSSFLRQHAKQPSLLEPDITDEASGKSSHYIDMLPDQQPPVLVTIVEPSTVSITTQTFDNGPLVASQALKTNYTELLNTLAQNIASGRAPRWTAGGLNAQKVGKLQALSRFINNQDALWLMNNAHQTQLLTLIKSICSVHRHWAPLHFSPPDSLSEFLTLVALKPEKYGTTTDTVNALPTVTVTSSLSDTISIADFNALFDSRSVYDSN